MDDYDMLIQILKKPVTHRTKANIDCISELLSTIKFFKEQDLTPKDLYYVAQGITYLYCEPGQDIIKYNDYGDIFYIILKGNASVIVPIKNKNENGEIEIVFKAVATLGEGKNFGELALINKARRY